MKSERKRLAQLEEYLWWRPEFDKNQAEGMLTILYIILKNFSLCIELLSGCIRNTFIIRKRRSNPTHLVISVFDVLGHKLRHVLVYPISDKKLMIKVWISSYLYLLYLNQGDKTHVFSDVDDIVYRSSGLLLYEPYNSMSHTKNGTVTFNDNVIVHGQN